MKLLIPIILFLSVLIWDILTDYNKWKKNIPVKHKKEFWIRFYLLLPSIILFTAFHPFIWWIGLILVSIMEGFTFMLLFDGFYNRLRGDNFWFTGSDDEDDASTDNFLQRLSKVQLILFKTIPTAISIFFYIYTL